MENSRKNVIELLEKERKLAHRMADHFMKKGDKEEHRAYIKEAIALNEAINLLTDEKYFNQIWANMENFQ